MAHSTDKAISSANLQGSNKLTSDKLFIQGNSYSGRKDTRFAEVCYCNVMDLHDSVMWFFLTLGNKVVLAVPMRV